MNTFEKKCLQSWLYVYILDFILRLYFGMYFWVISFKAWNKRRSAALFPQNLVYIPVH